MIAAGMKLFHNAVKFRNRLNYDVETQEISPYLNVEINKEQQRLLNPSVLDTITGYIIKDSQGGGAKLKLLQRRLNMVDTAI